MNKIDSLVEDIKKIIGQYSITNQNLINSIENLIKYSSSIEDVDIHPGLSASYKSFAFANTYNLKIYDRTQDVSSINIYYVLNMIAIAIITYNGFNKYDELENIADRLYLETNHFYGYFEHFTYAKMEEQLMDNMLNTDCRIVSTYLILKFILINNNYIIPYTPHPSYQNYRIENIFSDVYFINNKLLYKILNTIMNSIAIMPVELYNCESINIDLDETDIKRAQEGTFNIISAGLTSNIFMSKLLKKPINDKILDKAELIDYLKMVSSELLINKSYNVNYPSNIVAQYTCSNMILNNDQIKTLNIFTQLIAPIGATQPSNILSFTRNISMTRILQ